MAIPKANETYTYQDYCTWSDDERWEIIDGVAYNMSPAPTFKHQNIVGNIHYLLKNALKGKSCIPVMAPFDVVLSDYNVVQPDVIVVCDPQKITDKNLQGAPDLVIEILSPSTSKKDRWIKKGLFEKYGVREYIIIEPESQYAERFVLEDRKFHSGDVFDVVQSIPLKSLENVEIPMWEVFEVGKPSE